MDIGSVWFSKINVNQNPPHYMFTIDKQYAILKGFSLAAFIVLSLSSSNAAVIGYWRFENGNVTGDSGSNALDLSVRGSGAAPVSYQLPASGAGSKFSDPIPQTGQSNTYAIAGGGTNKQFQKTYYHTDTSAFTITSGITIEAYINLSLSGGTYVIAGQGGYTNGSWSLVVNNSSQIIFQSRSSAGAWGDPGLESVNSGLTLITGHDYYVAYSSTLSDTSTTGAIFYLQDLTAGTALQVVGKTHTNTIMYDSLDNNFAIGASSAPGGSNFWAGALDEVRLSNTQLDVDQLLISVPEPSSLLLTVVGAFGFLLYRRCRRAASC
jgi:Concanavalin A-like lectin/glucanases superfamily